MSSNLRSFAGSRAFPAVAALLLAACGGETGGETAAAPAVPAPSEVANPAAAGASQPHLAAVPGGGAVLSWLEPDGDAHALRYAQWSDGRWSEPRTLVRSDDLFVNWADFPSVVPIDAQLWAAHWLVMQPDAFAAYDIAVAVSTDAGKTWSEPVRLNDDETASEHGFVTLFSWGDEVGAVWLDGRTLANWDPAEDGTPEEDPDPFIGMSLRYAKVGRDGAVSEDGRIDEVVCDCCQTDVAVTASGPAVVYRDRSRAEIRDVVVRRFQGEGWSEPVRLGPDGWEIEGCPVNGPATAGRGDDIAAAWFTAADARPRVRLARSQDGARSFGTTIDVDGQGAFGQVDLVLLDDGASLVSWWRRRSGGTSATEATDASGDADAAAGAARLTLAVRRIAADGTLGPIRVVGESTAAQPLDVPQMVRTADGVLFAWTESGDDAGVRTSLAPDWH